MSVAFLSLSLASCLKDENIENQKYGMINLNAKKIIELYSDDTHANTTGLAFVNRDTVIDIATVHLAAEQPATEDVTVTLTTSNSSSIIADYNAEHHSTITQFPSNLFAYQGTGLTVVIPKGQREASVRIKVNPSTFNPSSTYGLGFSIASVDKQGYTISDNFKSFLAILGAKNSYDGIYSVVSGKVTRYTAPGVPANDALSGDLAGNPDVVMSTVSATTVTVPPSSSSGTLQWAAGNNSNVAGIDGLRFTVDPLTNAVTVSSTSNATVANWRENRYDPATRTFYLSFRWNPTANVREYEVVLKYKGPR